MMLVVILAVVMMVMLSLHLVMVLIGDIRLSEKKIGKGLMRLVYAATAKSTRASPRSFQKINDGK